MSGVLPTYWHGPDTQEVSADVSGGQLVMADSANAGKIKAATDAAATVLGVALEDAKLVSEIPVSPNPVRGDFPPAKISVANNVDIKVTYSGAAAYGQKLVAAAGGKVRALVTSGSPDSVAVIVGHCTEPAGATDGQVKRAFISA